MTSKARSRLDLRPVLTLGSLLCMASTLPAHAQINAATGAASPGRVEEQFQPPQLPSREDPNIEVRRTPAQNAPQGAENIRFMLRQVVLEGVTAYREESLAAVYGNRLGRDSSLADIYTIAADITRKYREDGYILTQAIVPPQEVIDGTVRIQVVEGFVDTVTVEGDNADRWSLVEGYVNAIKGKKPLNAHDMERALLLINDLPGIKARSILSPSKTVTGAADLNIHIDRKPFDAQLDANNYGTKYLGPYQLGAAGSLNSALGMNERVSAQVVYAPGAKMDPELMYYAFGYAQPVGLYGTTLRLDFSHTDTDPGYTLKEFDVEGASDFAGLTLLHPFVRSRNLNVTGRAGFDMRNVKTQDNIEPERKDRIRALRLGGRFEYLDTWLGTAYDTADVELSQGLGVFGSSESGDANTSRPGAEEHFTKVEAEVQRLQRIKGPVNVLVGVRGQWSNDALWSSEEFGLGGLSYGRGYDPSEIIGDSGIAGKTELQWLSPAKLPFVEDWQTYAFYDIGAIWNTDATAATDKRDSLASAGLGVRGTLRTGTSVESFIAFPLTRDVQTHNDTNPRLFVGISQKF